MLEALKTVGILVSGLGSAAFALLAWRLANGSRVEYDRNRKRSQSVIKAIKGELPTTNDGGGDSTVIEGIVVNRNNEWIEQGRLSAEAVSATVRPVE